MPVYTRPLTAFDNPNQGSMFPIEQQETATNEEFWSAKWRQSFTQGLADMFTEAITPDPWKRNADPNFKLDPTSLDPTYRPIWPTLARARSVSEVRHLQRKYDRTQKDYMDIARGSIPQKLSGLGFDLFEPAAMPMWFVPFGPGFRTAGMVGKNLRLIGAVDAEVIGREMVMHHNDASRDPYDSAKNLFTSTAIAGSMATLAGVFMKGVPDDLKNALITGTEAESIKAFDSLKTLYHGTAKKNIFDRVDMGKVGSGEGNTREGWGFYMTQRLGIAQWYAKTVEQLHTGQPVMGKASSEAMSRLSLIERAIGGKIGNVYTMRVNAESMKSFLNLDVPLVQQNVQLRKLLKDNDWFGIPPHDQTETSLIWYRRLVQRELKEQTGQDMDLETIRKVMTGKKSMFGKNAKGIAKFNSLKQLLLPFQKEVSNMLKAAGIKGSKYRDYKSRKEWKFDSEQKYNWVAYDESDIIVSRRNNKRLRNDGTDFTEMSLAEGFSDISSVLTARGTVIQAQYQTGDSVGAARVTDRLAHDMEVFMESPQSTGVNLEKALIGSPDLRLSYTTKEGLAAPPRINSELTIVGPEKNKYLPENGNEAELWTPLEAEVDAARNSLGNTDFAIKEAIKDIKKNQGERVSRDEAYANISRAAAGNDKMVQNKEFLPIVRETREWREEFKRRMEAVGMFKEPSVRARELKEVAVKAQERKHNKLQKKLDEAERDLVRIEARDEGTGAGIKKRDIKRIQRQMAKQDEETIGILKKHDDEIAKADDRHFNEHWGPRIYDTDKIRARPDKWVRNVIAGSRARGSTLSDEALSERAMDAFHNAATEAKSGQWGGDYGAGIGKPKHLKPITLEVDDMYVEEFLVRNVLNDHDSMIRNLMPELILRERGYTVVRKNDGIEVLEWTKELKDEYKYVRANNTEDAEAVAAKLTAKGDTEGAKKALAEGVKKNQKLLKTHEQSMKDIEHKMMKITGVGADSIAVPAEMAGFLREVRAWATGAQLGGSMLASLHEVTQAMMTIGFAPVAKAMGTLAINGPLRREVTQQMRAAIIGMEMRSARSVGMLRAELDDVPLKNEWKSIGSRRIAPFMMKYNGQNWFSGSVKTGAAVALQDQMIRHALGKSYEKVGSVAYDTARSNMAKVGIGQAELNKLGEILKGNNATYKESDGLYFGQWNNWDDLEFADRFTRSLDVFGQTTVVSHGAGALPIGLDNQVGKMFTQFRNVFFNMQGKTIIPSAQRLARGDMRVARQMTAMVAMSWMSYQSRMMLRHNFDMEKFQEEWDAMSIQDHVRETLTASGQTGLWSEILNGADNLSGGNASRLLGLNEGKKNFINRNLGLTGLSPGVSWADKAVRGVIGPALTAGAMTQDELVSLRYALPGNSIPYIKPALEAIQNSVIEGFPTRAEINAEIEAGQ